MYTVYADEVCCDVVVLRAVVEEEPGSEVDTLEAEVDTLEGCCDVVVLRSVVEEEPVAEVDTLEGCCVVEASQSVVVE